MDILACPDCSGGLQLESPKEFGEEVEEGALVCPACAKSYTIRNGIPRFVHVQDDYCGNFGWQWTRFRKTQIDRFSGNPHSHDRFFSETGWTADWLGGKRVLDAGCGAGRFADIACAAGARIVGVDISEAVDACRENLEGQGYDYDLVQASIYNLPFRRHAFDAVYSLGVLQHTPDPPRAIACLAGFVSRAGRMAVWVYERRWHRWLRPKYPLRILTSRLSQKANFRLSRLLTIILFPVSWLLYKIPLAGPIATRFLPIMSSHIHGLGLPLPQQYQWVLLDTYDAYSPRYDLPLKEEEIRSVLEKAGHREIERRPVPGLAISSIVG